MKGNQKKILIGILLITLTFSLVHITKAKAGSGPRKISQNDMIYFLMTDRFYDGDKSNDKEVIKGDLSQYQGGDFQGIIDKLDYIKGLGFTAIWISPVVKNDIGGYHGYWATDFYNTNEHFGSMDKLKELVTKAHDKGLKVIFDIVVNHTGPGHPWATNPKYENWFHPRADINYDNQASIENGWLAGLPDLNTENPEVKKYLIDMAKWWIKKTGIDGYRIDTVKHVPKEFWVDFAKEIKKDFPDFYLIGEVFNGDPSYVADYQKTGLSGLLDFPTYYAASDVFKGYKPASDLGNIIYKEGEVYNNRNLMGTFIDNHDVPRFVNQIFNLKDERLKSALSFMMTYTGIPIMYYGTEIGMEGDSDPDNRRNMDFNTKSEITDYVKKLTSLRKENNALTNGNIELLKSSDTLLSYARKYENNSVIAVFNTSEDKQKYEINIPEKYSKKNSVLTDYITGQKVDINNGILNIDMSPSQASIFVINSSAGNSYITIIFIAAGSTAAIIIIIAGVLIRSKKKKM